MKYTNYAFLLLILPVITLSACQSGDDDEALPLDPVVITISTALSEPTAPTNNAFEPACAYDGSNVHLVYSQDTGSGTHALKYTRRLGGGAFQAPADVFAASTVDSRNAHVALDSSLTLHMVWTEGTSPTRDVYYATRTSAGTISTPANLTGTGTDDVANPRVAINSLGRVFVCWEAAAGATSVIQYTRRLSSIWTAPVILPASPSGISAETPDICVDEGDLVYVFWSEHNGTSRDIRMVRSDDAGLNFRVVSGRELVVSGGVDMASPRVASGLVGEVFLTFVGTATNGDRALFTTKTITGGQFSSPVVLQDSQAGGLREPAISAAKQPDDSFTVMIAYNDGGSGGGNIMLVASSDNGVNYPGSPTNISQLGTLPAGNRLPCVAMDDNDVIVCWQGQPTSGGILRTFTTNNSFQLP